MDRGRSRRRGGSGSVALDLLIPPLRSSLRGSIAYRSASRAAFPQRLPGHRTAPVGAGIAVLPMISARGSEALLAQQRVSPIATRRADRALVVCARHDPDRFERKSERPRRARVRGDAQHVPGREPVSGHARGRAHHEIARYARREAENIMLGCGSSEVLRSAVQAFTSPTRALVSPMPSFELAADYAQVHRTPVKSPRVDAKLRTRPRRNGRRGEGRGARLLVQSEQPDGHGARQGGDRRASSTGSAGVRRRRWCWWTRRITSTSRIRRTRRRFRIVMDNPRAFVARTFSKVFGMAGMRVGYAVGRPESHRPHEGAGCSART